MVPLEATQLNKLSQVAVARIRAFFSTLLAAWRGNPEITGEYASAGGGAGRLIDVALGHRGEVECSPTTICFQMTPAQVQVRE